MKVKLYNQTGQDIGEIELPASIFEIPLNADLIHQAMVTQMANHRQVLAHTKDRSEVSGGGRKPWRQKGTGRARHGSSRSPIWIGGGVTFGPTKDRVFAKDINRKMKRKALFMALSSKLTDQELVVIDKLVLAEPKTKQLFKVMADLSKQIEKDLNKSSLMVFSKMDENVKKAVSNIPKVKAIKASDLNIVDVLNYKYLLMSQESIKVIKETFKI